MNNPSYKFSNDAHLPVMLAEAVQNLSPKDGETYVDGTFGAGGYSRAILKAADCKVFAIDRDPDVAIFAEKIMAEFPGRFNLILGNFGDMAELLQENGVQKINGVVLDLGVSSMQLTTPTRGFSFMHEGPLDMRMEKEGRSAEYLINSADEKELADIIYKYGGEKRSRQIARSIVRARAEKPISTTLQLAEIIRKTVRAYNDKIDPATRTFQAIRIWVNDELEAVAKGLAAAEKLLAPGGRLVVISFHSLEDSIIKDFMNRKSGKGETYSRHMPLPETRPEKIFSIITNKAVKPGDAEISANPKSRSAKLRAAIKTDFLKNHDLTVENHKNSL